MSEYSAQGSITVKRLRTGGSLYISFKNNGIPLYQGVNKSSGVVTPDWTKSENQPCLTPDVTSTRGGTVTLQNHKWYYNGNLLKFGAGDDWVAGTEDARFMFNHVDGSLKIVGNLASKTNIANDILTYECQAVIAGVEYNLTKSTDISIQEVGASSYYGTILASTEQLTDEVPTSTVTARLFMSAVPVENFTVNWYKDDTEWTDKKGTKEITVTREDVNGTQLFIAEFYANAEDKTPVFRAGLRIIDVNDEYVVICNISSVNKEVDTSKPVTVEAKLVNTKSNTVISPSGAAWKMDVMDRGTWQSVKTSNTNTIEVTTNETDKDGSENDVEVVGEVSWN